MLIYPSLQFYYMVLVHYGQPYTDQSYPVKNTVKNAKANSILLYITDAVDHDTRRLEYSNPEMLWTEFEKFPTVLPYSL